MRTPIPGIRWVDPEQTHLTLHFLGERPDGDIPRLVPLLQRCGGELPFTLITTPAGTFGTPSSPRVLWVGVEPSPPLQRLHRTLADGLVSLGIPVEDRPYHPHLTIARLKGVQREALRRVLAAVPGEFTITVERVVLYESRLTPAGALHREIASVSPRQEGP